jgi:ornithine carbamoyltransferase
LETIMNKDLLSCEEISRADLERIIDLSAKIKAERFSPSAPKPLTGKSVGMIFAKSSTRTRVSFEIGVHELGGYPLYMDQGKIQMGRGESPADTARVLSRYLQAIVIRTYKQQEIEELAKYSTIPIINALTDDYHPCQAITDVFTMFESAKRLDGLKMAFLGDGSNNMANSLMLICQTAGIDMVVGAPEQFKPREDIMKRGLGPGKCSWTASPRRP